MERMHIVIAIFVVVPLFFWYRVWLINRRKKSVFVKCPQCGRDQRLAKLQNYNCRKCMSRIEFFDEQGNPFKTLKQYRCKACHAWNFKGVITCVECGLANPDEI